MRGAELRTGRLLRKRLRDCVSGAMEKFLTPWLREKKRSCEVQK